MSDVNKICRSSWTRQCQKESIHLILLQLTLVATAKFELRTIATVKFELRTAIHACKHMLAKRQCSKDATKCAMWVPRQFELACELLMA